MTTLFQRTLIAASILTLAVTNTSPVNAMSRKRIAERCQQVSVIGHRGEPGDRNGLHFDENTIPSFNSAVRHGATEIETDLRLTKDSVWVLMHDATVDRTTKGHGAVSSLTAAEVEKLETVHGLKVPTLDRLLRNFSGTTTSLQLELKGSGLSKAHLQSAVDMVNAYSLHDQVSFTSSQGGNLLKIKEIDPTLTTGYIGSGMSKPSIVTLRNYGVDFVTVNYRVASKSYIDDLHQHGIRAGARSAENGTQFKKVISNGVDRVVTDYSRRYTSWCDSI